MKTLSSLVKQKNKKALVRVDYNVPLVGEKIRDTRRIDASFDTLRVLFKKGYQPLLLAHLGESTASLRPIATYLSKHFPVVFITEKITHTKKIKELLSQVSPKTIVLFENIRIYPEEEKNDTAFAKQLSLLGDIFVNDAFSVSHRAHASVVGISKKLPSYLGAQCEKEIKNLSKAVDSPRHPFLFILGGAKFSTKIPLIQRFIEKADHIVIAGALANTFLKVAGFEVGKSVAEEGYERKIKKLLLSEKLLLPVDVIVLRSTKKVLCGIDEVQAQDVIVDIGTRTSSLIELKIMKAKTVLWNGPTGWYEKGFISATKKLARALVGTKAKSIVGGGDTGAVVEKILKGHTNVFVSTGGGATLEYLATGALVGIHSVQK